MCYKTFTNNIFSQGVREYVDARMSGCTGHKSAEYQAVMYICRNSAVAVGWAYLMQTMKNHMTHISQSSLIRQLQVLYIFKIVLNCRLCV